MANSRRYLGVDLGAGGIKVVEFAEEKKRARLTTYGWAERSPLEISVDWLADPPATASILKKICERAHVTATVAVAALPVYSVFSSVISLAKVSNKELAAAVHWEAKKLIPLPVEEMVLDWKILPQTVLSREPLDIKAVPGEVAEPKQENAINVLLTAAPKELRDKYIDIFKKAGIMLGSLETEAFAFIRSLVGSDEASTIIVDIGARKSNVLIVERGIPFLAHSVDIGGKHFTESIALALNVPIEKAESLKHDFGTLEHARSGSVGEVFPKILEEVMTPIKDAVQYSLSIHRTQNSSAGVPEKIILTGGSAGLPGLVDYFTRVFDIRTFIGDPWARVLYPAELRPVLDTIGPRFAVGIGLAMRDIMK